MADRNTDGFTPDMERLSHRLRETKQEIKRLEAEEESLCGQLMTEAKNAGFHEGDEVGFSYEGLNMTVPAGGLAKGITDLLRRLKLWHCMSYTPKVKEVEKAIAAGKLTEEDVAPFRTTREPWFSLARAKKEG